MAYITDYEYYENNQVSPQDENWGSYQYVTLGIKFYSLLRELYKN